MKTMTRTDQKAEPKKYNLNRMYPFHFVFGALALYLLLYVAPSLTGIYYSFTDWTRFSEEINFVGFDNYIRLISADYHYVDYITNTLKFTVITTVMKTALGIALALMLNKGLKFKNFHRAVIFFPAILSLLITGLIFKSILDPVTGLLNRTLDLVGLDFLMNKWLVDMDTVFGAVMGVDIWRGTGYIMTIFLAGLQAIPESYYEAAQVDGANFHQKFRYITLPLLMPSITVTLVLNIVYGLRIFDVIYVLTNGGPGYATEVMYTAIFKEFGKGTYAVGNALSTIMVLVMVIIGFFIVKKMSQNEVEY